MAFSRRESASGRLRRDASAATKGGTGTPDVRRVLVSLSSILTLLAALVPSAFAAFPGVNGDIVFNSRRDGGLRQIYVMRFDGTQQTRLSDLSQEEFSPNVSADGSRIAFTGGLLVDTEVHVMDIDGSAKTPLTANAAFDTTPVWSPDGTKLAFSSNRDGPSEIYMVDADGTNVVRLTNDPASDFDPAWSPAGDVSAFTRIEAPAEAEIMLLDLTTMALINITNHPARDRAADWSPDGSQLTFVSDRDGNLEVYIMNDDGSAPLRLTNDAALDNVPAWSPDGRWIVFTSDRAQAASSDIYVMSSLDGSSVTRLTTGLQEGQPNWQALTTDDALEDISGDIQNLVDGGSLNGGQGKSLTVKLD